MIDLKSFELFKQYNNIFSLDYTFYNNWYKMLLLNTMVSTMLNIITKLASIFMKNETEIDYVWALLTLRKMIEEKNSSVYLGTLK